MKNKLFLLLLGFLGFASCHKEDPTPDDPPVMYGTPTAYFSIKGRVTDQAGAPVRGIRVTPTQTWHRYAPDPGFIPDQEVEIDPLYSEPIYTSESGEYELRNRCFGWSNFFVTVRTEDVDGPRNGGLFASQDTDIEITRENRTQDDVWMSQYEKQAPDIILTPDKEQ